MNKLIARQNGKKQWRKESTVTNMNGLGSVNRTIQSEKEQYKEER
jgi:hypothetical protein